MDILRYFKKRKLETEENEVPVIGNVPNNDASVVIQNNEVPSTAPNLVESQDDMDETDSVDCE